MKSYNNNKSYKVKPQSEEDYFSSTFNNPRNNNQEKPRKIMNNQRIENQNYAHPKNNEQGYGQGQQKRYQSKPKQQNQENPRNYFPNPENDYQKNSYPNFNNEHGQGHPKRHHSKSKHGEGDNYQKENPKANSGSGRFLSPNFISGLINKNDNEVIDALNKEDLIMTINNTVFKELLFTDITKILRRISLISLTPAKTIMNYFLNSNYFTKLEEYLKEIKPKIEQQLINNSFKTNYKIFLEDNIVLFTEFYFKFTNSLSVLPFDNLNLLIETIIKVNRAMQKLDDHKDLIDKFNELEKLNTELFANSVKKKIEEKTQPVKKPVNVPITYKDEEILLTSDEIYLNKQPAIEAHRAKGSYDSWERYFNTLFYLVREDGYRSLRKNIYKIINKGVDSKTIEKDDIYYYPDVSIVKIELGPTGLLFTLSFRTLTNKVNWCKRMLFGSLVIITDLEFSDFIMAVIAKNPYDMAKVTKSKGTFCQISLVGMDFKNFEKVIKFYEKPLQMFESKAYFEAYKHILDRLKSIDTRVLPFRDVFVDSVGLRNAIPSYLYQYIHIDGKAYPLNSHFPKYTLDDSQYEAYRYALTNKIAILQGPPGTGKTYIGCLITRILLSNINTPILVVCYTNHALDQFLKHISKFEQNIIRIGARCKDEELEKFMLRNVKEEKKMKVKTDLFKIKRKLQALLSNNEFNEFLACLSKGRYLPFETFSTLFPNLVNKLVSEFQNLTNCVISNTKGNREVYGLWMVSNKKDLNKQIERVSKFVISTDDIWAFSDKVRSLFKSMDQQSKVEINDAALEEEEQDEDDIRENLERMVDDSDDEDLGGNSFKNQTYEDLEELLYEPKKLNNDEIKTILIKKCLWDLPRDIKNEVVQYFKSAYINKHLRNMDIFDHVQALIEQKRECESYIDASYIANAKIVGMTTTGCAKYSAILEQVSFEIVIIEEAAEVLESHIAALLTRSLKHMILIGDHKQLKPKPYDYEIETKYNFNVSFFERLINNGFPLKTLSYQRRMRPEFADFVRLIYGENYKDDVCTLNRPNNKGFQSNIYFIKHNQMEGGMDGMASKINNYEASYLPYLAQYILRQGYNNITILTLYTGQLLCIRKHLKLLHLDKQVKVVTVDNYQGEEDDFILLSLVRSNKNDKIGFLSIINRVCVAFSRARLGFYVIGNLDFLSSCTNEWKSIHDLAIKNNIISDKLTLCCQRHKKITVISKPEDFIKLPEGGCSEPCKERLECGHVCEYLCHNWEHTSKRCKKQCSKVRDCGHPCTKRCIDDCGSCEAKTTKLLPCGHRGEYKCYLEEDDIPCQAICSRKLTCGHPCKDRCYQKCNNEVCTFKVRKLLLCGHVNDVECSTPANQAECKIKCEGVLTCTHDCSGTCGKCLKGTLHIPCEVECGKSLMCGHVCKQKCSQPCLCKRDCINVCSHAKCLDPCFAACIDCKEFCQNKCPHNRNCEKLCSELCDIAPCDQRCSLLLKCGHQCMGLCEEDCPNLCRICDPENSAFEIFFGNEDNPDALFYKLSCGHHIEVEALDNYMSIDGAVQVKTCPHCKSIIQQNKGFRYVNTVKIAYSRINKVKERMLQAYGTNYKTYYDQLLNLKPKFIKSKLCTQVLSLLDTIEKKKDYYRICTLYNMSTFLNKLETIEKITTRQILTNNARLTNLFKVNFENVYAYFRRIGDYNPHFLEQLDNKIENLYVFSKMNTDYINSTSLEKINKLLEESYFNIDEKRLDNIISSIMSEERKKEFIQIMNVATGRWYICPNGHPYSVGECGRPMESISCPECGAPIGGHDHQPNQGNVEIQNNLSRLNI
jgi:hypothetical protein